MKIFFKYISRYVHGTDKRVLLMTSVFVGLLIFFNYYFSIDDRIRSQPYFISRFFEWYFIFLLAFASPYFFYTGLKKRSYTAKRGFVILLFLSPAIFSLKLSLDFTIHFSGNIKWNDYWNHVFYWPVLLLLTASILFVIWKYSDNNKPFYGMTTKNISWKPYLLMLLLMLPLVSLASAQADFLSVYPKLKVLEGLTGQENFSWGHKLLFELAYGSDFITIELFFRGFLVLGFMKWAGKDAILPMACFYCTIHFGKPPGECISSYFGGLLLGIIVYNTKSIWGGLLAHLGIAWMMELGGYIGNAVK